LLATNSYFVRLLKEHDILYIPLAAYPLIPIAKKKGLRVIIHLHNYMPVRYSSVKYFFEPDVINTLDEFKLAIFHELRVHGSIIRTLLSPLSYTTYLLNKKQIRGADKIICVSRRQAEILVKNDPYLLNKIEVIYNPLSPELINSEPRKEPTNIPTFLYVGGDSFAKGFPLLIYMLSYLGKQSVNAKFILAGSYGVQSLTLLEHLKKTYKSLDIQVLGKMDFNKLIQMYKITWALIFPSIIEEPLPYAVLESSFLATIPIASNLGGTKEILSNSIGEKYMFDLRNLKSVLGVLNIIVNSDPRDIINDGIRLRVSVLLKFRNEVFLGRLLKLFVS
jgi:glycosyltransferase involved in cell wall biosynthesis